MLRGKGRILLAGLLGFVLGVMCTNRKVQSAFLGQVQSRPNILILSIESLRWDHVGFNGYRRPTTPTLDALAERGMVFSRAYSQASWTRPSIASTFSSTYQSNHRVSYPDLLEQFGVEGGNLVFSESLATKFTTMAETFGERGYQTSCLASNPHFYPTFGFSQGFDTYKSGVSDSEIVAHLGTLFQQTTDVPFFAFAHFMGPHFTYVPDQEYRKYDRYPGERNIDKDLFRAEIRGETKLTRKEIEHNIDLYDGEIEMTDNYIRQVIETLEAEGLLESTIVVIMADHGEEFYDHGGITHGTSVHEEQIRVPLLIMGPGIMGGTKIIHPVQNIDVYPTLHELALGLPPDVVQGNSLLPLIYDPDIENWYPVFSERANLHTIIEGDYKLIRDSFTMREELYNLHSDTYGLVNLIDKPEYKNIHNRLSKELDVFINTNEKLSQIRGFIPYKKLPNEVVAELRSLGYVE